MAERISATDLLELARLRRDRVARGVSISIVSILTETSPRRISRLERGLGVLHPGELDRLRRAVQAASGKE